MKTDVIRTAAEYRSLCIDVTLIPAHVCNDLSTFALSLVKDCFLQPGAEQRYQEWLKERKRRLRAGKE